MHRGTTSINVLSQYLCPPRHPFSPVFLQLCTSSYTSIHLLQGFPDFFLFSFLVWNWICAPKVFEDFIEFYQIISIQRVSRLFKHYGNVFLIFISFSLAHIISWYYFNVFSCKNHTRSQYQTNTSPHLYNINNKEKPSTPRLH